MSVASKPLKNSSQILHKISAKLLATSICSCLVASTLVVLPLSLFTPSAQAQSRKVRYVPPSNLDAPKVSSSGITRANSFIPLDPLPSSKDLDKLPVSQTISERPTIYFVSPKVSGNGIFTLIEQNDLLIPSHRVVYRKEFSLQNEAGIVAFKIPDDAPILEIGKIYRWKIVFGNDAGSQVAYSVIKRVLPTAKLVDQLKTLSKPIDRAGLLAQEGIWVETVQTLAEAQQPVPTSIEIVDEWTDLMKSANLSFVLQYRFVSQPSARESITLPKP